MEYRPCSAGSNWTKPGSTGRSNVLPTKAYTVMGSANNVYAADGTQGPWSSSPSDRIAWGSNATSATLFDGNWLNWLDNPPTVDRTRMEVVQEVTKAALDGLSNIDVGLMHFNPKQGGPVVHALENIEDARDNAQQIIDDLPTVGSTPISEALYEAGQYLAGRNVDFGNARTDNLSVAASRVGGTVTSPTYRSPLTGNGQNNYIVLLTDGEATEDKDTRDRMYGLPGYSDTVGTTCNNLIDGDCLDDMAAYLYNADLRPDLPGKQNAIVHTIGFYGRFADSRRYGGTRGRQIFCRRQYGEPDAGAGEPVARFLPRRQCVGAATRSQ